MGNDVRIDKFLWAVRLFKTRSLAAEACKKGRVRISELEVKASRTLKIGDVIEVKKPPITYSYKLIALLQNRVSAKLVADYIENLTSEEEMMKLEKNRFGGFFYREKGAGRPTKKERRVIDNMNTDYNRTENE